MTRDQLLRALEALPAGAQLTLPVSELREALGHEAGPVDLDVAAVARQFSRSPSAVRAWCESGLLPGAYRLRGRGWRIPPAAVVAFKAAQAEQPTLRVAHPRTRGKKANLAAWREEVPA